MKCFSILTLVLMITLIISACGAPGAGREATPTVNVVELQSTMAAAAFTMIAGTQSAIPTATLTATFTNTPPPTDTPLPLPSSGVTFTPVPNSNAAGGDPCVNTPLPASLQGQTIRLRLNNSTRATLAVSVYLSQTTPQTVCGYRIYTVTPEQPLIINDLVEGCYTLWAWNPVPEDYFIVTNGAASCITGSDTAVFDISTSSIRPRR